MTAVDASGTLFLDEVGGLPAALRARRLGFIREPPGLRLFASSRQGREALQGEAVQAYLLYRLNIVEILLPSLREREDDLYLLAEHFLRLFARRYGRAGLALSREAADAIAAASWPGDVRTLRQAMERAVVLAEGRVLRTEDIPLGVPAPKGVAAKPGSGDLNLAGSEKAIVEAALPRHGFNVSYAARELGLTRTALYGRMARHGL